LAAKFLITSSRPASADATGRFCENSLKANAGASVREKVIPVTVVAPAPALSMASITARLAGSLTSPNTVCTLLREGMETLPVKKNWLPLVFGPELAIEKT
jgi:hypothetical protein